MTVKPFADIAERIAVLVLWLWPSVIAAGEFIFGMITTRRLIEWDFITLCVYICQVCLGGIFFYMIMDRQQNEAMRKRFEERHHEKGGASATNTTEKSESLT